MRRSTSWAARWAAHSAAAILAAMVLTGATLPESPPLPAQKPAEPKAEATPDTPVATPRPRPATDDPPAGKTPSGDRRDAGTSEAKPDEGSGQKAQESREAKPEEQDAPAATTPEAEPEPKISAVVAEDPAKFEACLRDLKALGAQFETQEPIKDEDGVCGIEKPILMTQALPGVALSDPSPMRCEAALALSHWLKDTVQPTLALALPDQKITGVRNAPAYTCRKRNGAETGKISEHARGNAIDIIGLDLSNGEPVAMTPKAEDPTLTGAFQRTITAGACLHFTTVLSPGSDATHQDHLHLDVLERKGGYRYCR